MDLVRLGAIAVVGTLCISLALVVLVRKPADRAHLVFAAAVFLTVGWLVLAFLSDQPAYEGIALQLNRLTLSTAIILGMLFYYFVLVFPDAHARPSPYAKLFLGIGLPLAVLTASTPLVVSDVSHRERGTDIHSGPLLMLMALWLAVGFVLMLHMMARKYRDSEGRAKAQLKFVLLGLTLFAAVAILLGLLIPMLTGDYRLAELNTFSTLILVGFIAYAMTAHRFMDIRFAVIRSVGYSVLLAVLAAVLVGLMLSIRTGWPERLGLSPDVLFSVTFLLTVILFQPLRHATERFTDRIFYRRTYNPDELLSHIGGRLLSILKPGQLGALIASDLAEGMRLTFAAVDLRRGDACEVISTSPAFTESDSQKLMPLCTEGSIVVADELEAHSDAAELLNSCGVRVLAPLVAQHELVGAVYLGLKQSGATYSRRDIRFLENITREAAIAAQNAHLFEALSQTEEEVRHINANLEQLVNEQVEELQAANEELEEANEAKTLFLRSMSHELRTPLNSVIGFSSIMLQGAAGEVNHEQRRQLEMIRHSGQHLLELINDILDLSRIEAGQVEVQMERFDVAKVVHEALQTVTPAAEKKGLAVRLELPEGDDAIEIVSDGVKVHQILLNLLGNAVKFTDSGSVELRVARGAPRMLAVSVKDTGPGIPDEDRGHIFGEFYQREPDSGLKQEGTGLGLAISRRLAALLGGAITLENEVGKGSTFTLLLPEESPYRTGSE